MNSSIVTVGVAMNGGPVSVKVTCPDHPQGVAGAVTRYNEQKKKPMLVGEFTSFTPEVPLGSPSTIDGKFFLVRGLVVSMNDATPTPYQVAVEVIQNQTVLHRQVPEIGGSGTLEKEDVPFQTAFGIDAEDRS